MDSTWRRYHSKILESRALANSDGLWFQICFYVEPFQGVETSNQSPEATGETACRRAPYLDIGRRMSSWASSRHGVFQNCEEKSWLRKSCSPKGSKLWSNSGCRGPCQKGVPSNLWRWKRRQRCQTAVLDLGEKTLFSNPRIM